MPADLPVMVSLPGKAQPYGQLSKPGKAAQPDPGILKLVIVRICMVVDTTLVTLSQIEKRHRHPGICVANIRDLRQFQARLKESLY